MKLLKFLFLLIAMIQGVAWAVPALPLKGRYLELTSSTLDVTLSPQQLFDLLALLTGGVTNLLPLNNTWHGRNTYDFAPTGTGAANGTIAINTGASSVPSAYTMLGITANSAQRMRLDADGNFYVSGDLISSTTARLGSLTASRPVLSDANKKLVSGQIDLANSNHVTGDLPDANLTANVPLLNLANTFTTTQTMPGLILTGAVTPSAGSVWTARGSGGQGYWGAAGGGGGSWGSITGTLSAQTDLQSALDAKLASVTADTPLSGSGTSGSHLVIANAAADGATKGASTYTAADFDAASGVISIDYTNGQAASGSLKGFLTAADWTTFNGKQAALTLPLTLANGGSSKALTASTGGIVWTDADSMEILAGTATARQIFWSGATATPAWSPYTLPATLTGKGWISSSSSSAIAEVVPGAYGTTVSDSSGTIGVANASDHQFLGRHSTTMGFFAIDLATADVTGVLPSANINTNLILTTIARIHIGNSISVPATGVIGVTQITRACHITKVTVLGNVSGSAVVDLWVDTYANYPPTIADTITASALPTLSSTTKSQDSTLTGWNKVIGAGSSLIANLNSISTITSLDVIVEGTID